MKYLGSITDDKDLVSKKYVDDAIPTNVSDLTNDAGYLTTHQSIKTINSTSMVGSGNVAVQPTLVSGTNIKTVNGTSLLGSGNIATMTASTVTASLTAGGWSSNTQTATVSGVTASNVVIVSPASDSIGTWSSCGVYCSAQGSNSLTFKCATVPTGAITANVIIIG